MPQIMMVHSQNNAERAIKDLLDWINSRGKFEDEPREETTTFSSAQGAVFALIPFEIAKLLDQSYPVEVSVLEEET